MTALRRLAALIIAHAVLASAAMAAADMPAFLAGMPKAELHIHIEGVLEPEMKFDMARRNGLVLPYDTVEDVIAAYDFDDLSTFLAARYEGDRVLITEQDFYDLTMAYFEKGREENLIYAEIFFDPRLVCAWGSKKISA